MQKSSNKDKSISLAAENSECMSSQLRSKAKALRNLSTNAKNWEHDMKRASQNLRLRIEQRVRAEVLKRKREAAIVRIQARARSRHNGIDTVPDMRPL